jgi:methyl coenzyme M reductase subunit C-like uncharacterized protein (methanogenesis marker protein 7)
VLDILVVYRNGVYKVEFICVFMQLMGSYCTQKEILDIKIAASPCDAIQK